MLIDMGARAEGMTHLERAVALAPNEPDATYDIGTVLLQEENFAGAAARFRAVLAIRPGWAEAHNHLGIALAQQGRMADALAEFERAVTARPDYAEARANRDQARAVLRSDNARQGLGLGAWTAKGGRFTRPPLALSTEPGT